MKYGQKLNLGDTHYTPRNIQEVQASKLGMPRGTPSSSTKYQVIFQDTIFLLLYMLCVVLGVSLFSLSVFFCFVCYNKWLDHIMFVLERDVLRFSLPRTLYFSLFSFNECSLFSSTAFSFHFSP
jgi:hypothetical protein